MNGDNERRIAEGFGPAWSPDGEQIAFTQRVVDETFDVHVINTDGSDEITLMRNASSPVWSPDGEHILFEQGPLDEQRLYVMRSDGTDASRLTDGPGDWCAVWSPDGERIAFCSTRDYEVYVMDSDGRNAHRVSEPTTSESGSFVTPYPAWSPDGTEIAFPMFGPEEESEVIAIVGADGTNQRTLSPLPPTVEYTTDTDPVWSPDGAQIVFVNGEAGLGGELWIMNADGTGRRRLSNGPFSEPDQGLDWDIARP